MALPPKKSRYTWADVLTWDEIGHIEIINGEAYMAALPTKAHQDILMALSAQLYNFLEGKKCRVYPAPFGVRLFEKGGDTPEDVDTVVEPDISVVCDHGKLDEHGCKGAPDLVMEILSPSTQRHDRLVKLNLYQRAGVREYWIVNPEDSTVQVMLLNESGVLQPHEVYDRKGIAKVNVLNGCFLELERVFPK